MSSAEGSGVRGIKHITHDDNRKGKGGNAVAGSETESM